MSGAQNGLIKTWIPACNATTIQWSQIISLSKAKELFSKSGPLQESFRWLLSCGLISWFSQGAHWSNGLDSHIPNLTFIKHVRFWQDQKLNILSNLVITPKYPWLELRKLKVIKLVVQWKTKQNKANNSTTNKNPWELWTYPLPSCRHLYDFDSTFSL